MILTSAALEEFSAMEERHRFLTEQLDDLKRSYLQDGNLARLVILARLDSGSMSLTRK